MPYIGNNHIAGDHTNNFKVLDDISSYTATFDGSATSVVDTTNNTIRVVEHRFIQGQRVTYTNGTGGDIGGLTNNTAYFVIFDGASTFKLATSASNAANNTAINLSAVGTGSSHTLNAAFDGVNTKFKLTHSTGTGARLNNATQVNVAINNVLQKPNQSTTYTEGFIIEDNHKIAFKTAPTSEDIFWGSIIANTLTTFDISDHNIDTFTGDGSTTEFNLSHTPANNESLMVTINGVLQHPSNASTARAYTLIANVIQFTAAPGVGDEIQVRHLGFAGATTADVSGFYGRTGNVVLTSNDHITTGNINAGIVTATSFDGTFSSNIGGSNANFTGIVTAGTFKGGNIDAVDGAFSGNVTIGGTLTYEDVTNIDSVGIITARNGIDCNGDIDVDGHTNLDNVSVAGITTFSGIVDAVNTPASIRVAQDIQHKGDADTKISFSADNTISFDTAGSTRFGLSSSGNIELHGTQTGNNVATIYNGTGFLGLYASSNSGVNRDFRFFSSNSNSNESLRIASNGNVNVYKDLDVDGHTNLDHVSIAGITTFTNSGGVADFKPIQLEKSGTSGASRIQFLENGTNKGGITYSHDNNRMELIAMSGNDIVFYSDANLTTRINSSGHVVPGTDSTYDLGLTGTRWRNVYTDHINVAGVSTAIRYDVNFVNAEIKLTTNQSSFSRYGRINHYHNNGTTEHNAIQFSPRNGATGRMMFYNQVGGTVTERLRIDGTDGIQPSAHIIPMTDSTYNLGSNGTRFANVYADTLYGNGSNLTGIDTDLVSDTSPQLGGDLDTNSHHILLDDSHSVKWGNGTELEILHTGSSGYGAIHNSQGNLLVDTTGYFYVRNTDGSKNSIIANPAGNTSIYHDNNLRYTSYSGGVKISTDATLGRLVFADTSGNFAYQITGTDPAASGESGGRLVIQDANGGVVVDSRTAGGNIFLYNTIKLNGNATADNLKLIMGAGEDLQLYHSGSHSYITNSTGALIIQAASNNEIQLNGNGQHAAKFNPTGSSYIYYNGNPRFSIGSSNTVHHEDFVPSANNTYSLGHSSYRWGNIYGGYLSCFVNQASTYQVGEFRNEHSTYGGGVRFKSNNTYGSVEIMRYDGSYGAGLYNSTGGWHWDSNLQFHGRVDPWDDSTHDLGTNAKRWRTLYADTINVSANGNNTNGTVANFRGGTYNQINIAHANNSGWGLLLTNTDQSTYGSNSGYHFSTNTSVNKPCAVVNVNSDSLHFGTANTSRFFLTNNGHFLPYANNSYDIGGSSNRVRNIYTNDLNLSNEGGKNDVDGTWGSYTIQEGEDDLFLINKRSGKKYKFNLTEVS